MKKVLVWSEDNHRAFIDDISYEIRKTLFSEIGMTQKEALVHWYHEITKSISNPSLYLPLNAIIE
ncbi:hypothetical protein Bca101_073058 [Brassica carinata]